MIYIKITAAFWGEEGRNWQADTKINMETQETFVELWNSHNSLQKEQSCRTHISWI